MKRIYRPKVKDYIFDLREEESKQKGKNTSLSSHRKMEYHLQITIKDASTSWKGQLDKKDIYPKPMNGKIEVVVGNLKQGDGKLTHRYHSGLHKVQLNPKPHPRLGKLTKE